MNFLRQRPYLTVILLALLLGFSFMGSRSLFEPDEGRYTNVALNIVDSNEWISLHRHPDSLHFTKPPLTYWTIAASVKTFGFNIWAARLPIALAYILSVLMVFQLGKVFCREKPWLPALIFATSPLPFFAGNYISTDFILAACETLAVLCFAQYAFLKKTRYWMDAMWAGFGLAFLAKGPPGLLPLMAIIVFLWQQKDLKALFRPLGLSTFVIIGLAWYGIVIQRHPGLLDYFIGHEVIARVSNENMQRSPEWYGQIKVYLPTFVLGALPWLIALAVVFFKRRLNPDGSPPQLSDSDKWQKRFLWFWFVLPLIVFCLSRSRMPLYVLPLFTPLSLLLARSFRNFSLSHRLMFFLALWMVILIGGRYALSHYEHNKDPKVFAQKLLVITKEKPREIIFVEDMARYGLHLYLGSQINKASFKPQPKSISDSQFDMTLSQALDQKPGKRIFVLKRENEQYFENALREKNLLPILLGTIANTEGESDQDRLIYTIPGEFEQFKAAPEKISSSPSARTNWAIAKTSGQQGLEVFAFYGLGTGKTYRDIDVHAFSPSRNQWRLVTNIPVKQGVLASSAVSVNNKIYLAGGYSVASNGDEKSTPDLFEFDPMTESFKLISQIPIPVDDTVLLAWHDRYLVFVSGWHDTANVKDVQLFDLHDKKWLRASEYPGAGVFGHSGGIVDDSMIICDGVTAIKDPKGKNQFAMSNRCFRGDLNINDPTQIKWTELPKHPGTSIYRAAASGTMLTGVRVLFAGGANRPYNYDGIGYDGAPVSASSKVFSYDLRKNEWQTHRSLSVPSMDHRALIEIDGKFYMPGGMRDPQTVTNEVLAFEL
jgi:4-amino-4-deoxy-L-arabinose transferase-like glycosyltransferase/N-acetylneuraminic acid mutarotase